MNQAIHAVDLLQWFAGMPAEVCAWTTRCVHTGIEMEDTAVAALRYPNGALGTIEASTAVYPEWLRRIEVCGENGSVMLEDNQLVRWEFRESRPGDDAMTRSAAPRRNLYEGHLRQIQDMVDSIRAGRPQAVDGHTGRNAVALVLAVYDSASSHAPVRVSQ